MKASTNKLYTLDAQPTEAELEVFGKVRVVLEKSQDILKDIQQYTGATEAIRQVGHLQVFNK